MSDTICGRLNDDPAIHTVQSSAPIGIAQPLAVAHFLESLNVSTSDKNTPTDHWYVSARTSTLAV